MTLTPDMWKLIGLARRINDLPVSDIRAEASAAHSKCCHEAGEAGGWTPELAKAERLSECMEDLACQAERLAGAFVCLKDKLKPLS